MKKLLMKHDEGIFILEDIFTLLDHNLAAFRVLFILAIKSHKRIVEGISYYETIITEKDLQKFTTLPVDDIWDALECLEKEGLVAFCIVDNAMVFMLPRIGEMERGEVNGSL
jgi:hypothetical protein